MAINFNALPTEKPAMGTIIPKGQYIATIKKAEMKQGKDTTKPPYLNLELDIKDEASETEMGKIWAILTEAEHPLPRYQLSRFITALQLPIRGEFDLKDLTKMVVNKQLKVDITPEERGDNKEPQRSVVDVNAGEIFYPLTETTPQPEPEMETPFVPSGSEDGGVAPQTMSQY